MTAANWNDMNPDRVLLNYCVVGDFVVTWACGVTKKPWNSSTSVRQTTERVFIFTLITVATKIVIMARICLYNFILTEHNSILSFYLICIYTMLISSLFQTRHHRYKNDIWYLVIVIHRSFIILQTHLDMLQDTIQQRYLTYFNLFLIAVDTMYTFPTLY